MTYLKHFIGGFIIWNIVMWTIIGIIVLLQEMNEWVTFSLFIWVMCWIIWVLIKIPSTDD